MCQEAASLAEGELTRLRYMKELATCFQHLPFVWELLGFSLPAAHLHMGFQPRLWSPLRWKLEHKETRCPFL